jgi:FixJ family two-component response regulator
MSSFAMPSKVSFGRWDILPPSTLSAEDYLRSSEHGTSSCLISDIQMPGMSGADLQAQLIAEGNFTPMIFMTAFDNEKIRARVLKAGAYGT